MSRRQPPVQGTRREAEKTFADWHVTYPQLTKESAVRIAAERDAEALVFDWDNIERAIEPHRPKVVPLPNWFKRDVRFTFEIFYAAVGARSQTSTKQTIAEECETLISTAERLQSALFRGRSDAIYEVGPGIQLSGATLAAFLTRVADQENAFRAHADAVHRVPTTDPLKRLGIDLFLLGHRNFKLPLTSKGGAPDDRRNQPPNGPLFGFVQQAMAAISVVPSRYQLSTWCKAAFDEEKAAKSEIGEQPFPFGEYFGEELTED